jgi:hypothetical protein
VCARGEQDKKEGEEYNGGRDAEAFISFFNERSGLERTGSGGWQPTAGRVPALDALAQRFMSSKDDAERTSIASEAAEAAKWDSHKNTKEFGRFSLLYAGHENHEREQKASCAATSVEHARVGQYSSG